MLCRMRLSFVVADAVAVAVAAQLCICPFHVAVACLIATKNSKKGEEKKAKGECNTRRNKEKQVKENKTQANKKLRLRVL